ncbi:MAG: serine/threonine-protein kinase [Marmoricola sp.]
MIAGRYSLEREIGRGGMGAVWLGTDEVLGRQVALKKIGLMPGADGTDMARAEREARLSASLHHPHVVTIFNVVSENDSDARWLVMEYVDGVHLGQLVREEGPLSPDAAAPLLWQAADALAAAHAAGMVHRDVKPSNILVDRNRVVKLTDFGIARAMGDPSLTQTGLLIGSPAYLAPEVATGGKGGEAADVWSLGATLFHVLAGRPPYDIGDNMIGGLYRIVNEEPPRLENAGWLAPLLDATLVKDPVARMTMAQVRDFLAAGGEPTRAEFATQTQPLTEVAPVPAPTAVTEAAVLPPVPAAPADAPAGDLGERSRPRLLLVGLVLAGALVLGLVLYAVMAGDEPTSRTPSGPSTSQKPAGPTEAGMKSFIRDYVTTVAEDPSQSWQMLTPKFQQESGGFEKYQGFWGAATNGRVLSISANAENLSVSYQVRFDNFDNGPGPTVLDLSFEDGRYLIDGERSEGFTPAG